MKRRKFIQKSALAAASIAVLPSMLHAADWKEEVGIQLYTLKDVIFDDAKGVLKKISKFGYKKLEIHNHKEGKLYGMSTKEFGKCIADFGMTSVSGHYGLDLVQGDWEKDVADAKELGLKYMVLPWLEPSLRNEEKIKEVCGILNKAGEVCKKYEIEIQYHNHDFEFQKAGDRLLYDIMLEELDPTIVGMEMDLYWVVFAGQNPLTYFENYPGRFSQWHVKDMDKEVSSRNTEVGDGAIDFRAIFAKAGQSGMKHFYVEQEYFSGSPLESAKICINNLKNKIL